MFNDIAEGLNIPLHLFNQTAKNLNKMTAIEFNASILKERSSLKGFALSLTRNSEDALDLMQETYLKAITYRNKFEANSNLRAWLFTIMKNSFINSYRRNRKAKSVMVKGDEQVMQLAFKQNSYDHSESRMHSKEILKEIEKLDNQYKVPFTRYYNGYKYEEIAAELKLPIGTVKSRIFIARRILMEALKHYRN